jgi:hypothetical protein
VIGDKLSIDRNGTRAPHEKTDGMAERQPRRYTDGESSISRLEEALRRAEPA